LHFFAVNRLLKPSPQGWPAEAGDAGLVDGKPPFLFIAIIAPSWIIHWCIAYPSAL
jgi:hypothetical protein